MDNIVITEKGMIYKERFFELYEYQDLLKIIPRKVNLIIADENILIKTYEDYENIKNIKSLIDEDFFSGNGILIDNIYNHKNKKLIIYGIRSNNINIFYENNINSIKPIQKIVADYLVKVNKFENIKFIFGFNEKTYLNTNNALYQGEGGIVSDYATEKAKLEKSIQ